MIELKLEEKHQRNAEGIQCLRLYSPSDTLDFFVADDYRLQAFQYDYGELFEVTGHMYQRIEGRHLNRPGKEEAAEALSRLHHPPDVSLHETIFTFVKSRFCEFRNEAMQYTLSAIADMLRLEQWKDIQLRERECEILRNLQRASP